MYEFCLNMNSLFFSSVDFLKSIHISYKLAALDLT